MVTLASDPSQRNPESYLLTEDVARGRGISLRKLHELTRLGLIPHRVLPHGRRCLFDPRHLAEWEDGAELETIQLPHGGRLVRPVAKP